MSRALTWAALAFAACTALGLPILWGLIVTLIATIAGG